MLITREIILEGQENDGALDDVKVVDSETYVIKEGLQVTERFFSLPLDYSQPEGLKIRVFARHVVPLSKGKADTDLPYLLYLQGGPGFESPPPGSRPFQEKVHKEGYQTVWLDQRGTGLSTPLEPSTVPDIFKTSDEEIAKYLKFFRADSIVKDCEEIRKILLGADKTWTLLGQSFGGFCAITYLSFFPEGLKEVFLTGGLAPLVDSPEKVYEKLCRRVVQRNKIFYKKYPQDVLRVKKILAFLHDNNVTLPSGGKLSPIRFLSLGISFGSHGGIDTVHRIIFQAVNDLEVFGKLSYKTLHTIDSQSSFDSNPIYAILHEPIYCQGKAHNWTAWNTLKNNPQYYHDNGVVYFYGEIVLPEMFDDFANLRPWKGAAEILAKDDTWGPLYDLEQLKKNEVNVSAVTYYDDMYVDFDLAQRTAQTIANVEQYITNQLSHSGIREDPGDVFEKLFKMSRREVE